MPLLRIEHLRLRFGGLIAVDDVCFDVRQGEITALIGPNGAGKTSVFNCVTGFYKPDAGRLMLAGHRLERMSDTEIARRARVARTFQNIRLFAGMTALENLIVARHNTLMRASGYTIGSLLGLGPYRAKEKESIETAKYWLDRIGLYQRANDIAGSLSYGAQRQLEIVRAMMSQPVLLCLDEPAAGLNAAESAKLNELLHIIRGSHGTSILLIEHDMPVVMAISDHVIVLDYGRKIADGAPAAIRRDEAVIAAYLGIDETQVKTAEIAAGL